MTTQAYKILRTHYDALVVLRDRMTPSDLAWDRINARVEEARRAMRGMPDDMITTGELHTAFRVVCEHDGVTAKFVGSAIQSSDVRGGNALRQLEDAGLVATNSGGEWIATSSSPESQYAAFEATFPGLTTTPKPTRAPQRGAQPNKEAAMPAANTTTNVEFTKDTAKPSGVKFEQVGKMIDALRKSDAPIGFNDLCKKVGAKYPQDVQAAMFALDIVGAIERYTFVEEGSTRSLTAYAWVGDSEARPTPSTSTASKPRSRRSKKADTPAPEATEEATPAAA